MNDTDKPKFLATLTGLAAMKPGGKITPEALELWWRAMQGWSLPEFQQAAEHLARSVEFMPNPYHFEQLRKASGPSAAEAWSRVLETIRTLNPHGGAVSIDERTDRVVQAMGGYRQLAMTSSSDMHFRERRFAELWAELGEVEQAREALPNASRAITWRGTSGPKSAQALLGAMGERQP